MSTSLDAHTRAARGRGGTRGKGNAKFIISTAAHMGVALLPIRLWWYIVVRILNA